MSKKANPTLIGSFVIGAIAIVVFALLALGNLSLNKKSYRCVLYFQGSLHGLDIGAPVAYRGVNIGKVSDIVIAFNQMENRFTIPVYIDIEEQTTTGKIFYKEAGFDNPDAFFRDLIHRGLRAELKLRSIVTGKLFIEFSFAPATKAVFIGEDKRYIEIPTLASGFDQLTQALEELPIKDLVTKTVSALDSINHLLNSEKLQKTINHLNGTLLHTDELVVSLEKVVPDLAQEIKNALADFSALSKSTKILVEQTDQNLAPLLTDIEASFAKINNLIDRLLPAVDNLAAMTDINSPLRYELDKTLLEISRTAQSVSQLTDYLLRHPDALVTGRKEQN